MGPADTESLPVGEAPEGKGRAAVSAGKSGQGDPSARPGRGPRPADEAREALRRAVASAEGAVRGGASSPGGRAPRPSDAAREALHRARRARRGSSAGEAGAASRPELAPPVGEASSGDAEEAPTAARPPAGEGRVRTESATRGGEDAAAPDSAGQASDGHDASRPGDIAREALRAAREERARALAREQVDAAKRPRREPAPRVPRTTRGDRAADRRAREIRETLADAFRMPDMEDPAPGVEGRAGSADAPTHGPAGEPPDPRASDEPASAPETTRLPTGDRGAAPDTVAHSHGPASAADHQAPEPTPGHPRVPAAAPRGRGEPPARPATATPP
ncbi:hypothetical protein GA0115245_12112, partial [Streptomyces sp. di188]